MHKQEESTFAGTPIPYSEERRLSSQSIADSYDDVNAEQLSGNTCIASSFVAEGELVTQVNWNFEKVWESTNSKLVANYDGKLSVWKPIPPKDFYSLGDIMELGIMMLLLFSLINIRFD